MKRILFSQTFNHVPEGVGHSVPLFKAGEHYPADNEEARRCIARGIAEEIDVPDEPAAEEAAGQDAATTGDAAADADAAAAEQPAAEAPAKTGKAKK